MESATSGASASDPYEVRHAQVAVDRPKHWIWDCCMDATTWVVAGQRAAGSIGNLLVLICSWMSVGTTAYMRSLHLAACVTGQECHRVLLRLG